MEIVHAYRQEDGRASIQSAHHHMDEILLKLNYMVQDEDGMLIIDYPDSFELLQNLETKRYPYCMDSYPGWYNIIQFHTSQELLSPD